MRLSKPVEVHTFAKQLFKVAPWDEKTEVFKKG